MFLHQSDDFAVRRGAAWRDWVVLGVLATCFAAIVPLGVAWGASPLSVRQDSSVITVMRGDQPVLRYRFDDVPFKPYADRFYSPAGRNVLRDAPSDHLHHHGLMFALMVDDVDFWAESPDQSPGTQRSGKIEILDAAGQEDPSDVRFRQRIDWVTGGGTAWRWRTEPSPFSGPMISRLLS